MITVENTKKLHFDFIQKVKEQSNTIDVVSQLHLWQLTRTRVETALYLQIVLVPVSERVNPRENRYILLLQPLKIRASGGQFTADEAYQIAKCTKDWDWLLDVDGRLRCLPRLEALLDSICKRSNLKGGEA